MHDSAFCGWRGMRPLEWRPARVRIQALLQSRWASPGPSCACQPVRGSASGGLGRPLQDHTPRPRPTECLRGRAMVALSLVMAGGGGRQRRRAAAVTYIAQGTGTIAVHLSDISRCCGTVLGRTACLSTTLAFWSRLSTRASTSRCRADNGRGRAPCTGLRGFRLPPGVIQSGARAPLGSLHEI
jgi:hypothetical protein